MEHFGEAPELKDVLCNYPAIAAFWCLTPIMKESLSYPNNLGEGKLPNARDNQAHYYMGIIYEAIGQKKDAVKYYEKALSGSPSLILYYNDLPSDYIFYQGLAYSRLHKPEMAKGCFHKF